MFTFSSVASDATIKHLNRGHYASRGVREQQILHLMRVVGEGGITAHDVARVLDITPNTALRAILNDLVARGILESGLSQHRANTTRRLYRLASVWK